MNEYILVLKFKAEPNVDIICRLLNPNAFIHGHLNFLNPFTKRPTKLIFKKMGGKDIRPIYYYEEGEHNE